MPTIDETEEQYHQEVLRRIKKKTVYEGECWRYTGKHVGKGYASISYKDRSMRLNRFIAWIYHKLDRYDRDQVACHIPDCKFKDCWRPEHIYVGTQKENVADQIKAGTFHYGTDNLFNNSHRGPKKRY